MPPANGGGGQSLGRTADAGSGGDSLAPNMIGDFFGGTISSRALVFSGQGAFIPENLNAGFSMANGVLDDGTPGFLHRIDLVRTSTTSGFFFYHQIDQSTQFLNRDGSGLTSQARFTNLIESDGTVTDPVTGVTTPSVADSGPYTAIVTDPGKVFFDVSNLPLGPGVVPVYDIFREITLPAPGEMVGRIQVSDNNSPVPQDRLIFDYSYFDSVRLTQNGNDVHRFAPGFEKTFFNGRASLDVRLPFASALESDILTSTGTSANGLLANTSEIELGNLNLIGKLLMQRNRFGAWSAGLQATLPTAEDVTLSSIDANGRISEVLRVKNESVRLMPFIGAMHTPNDRTFLQYFVQADFDSNGNTIQLADGSSTNVEGLDFLYADVSLGYWLFKESRQTRSTYSPNGIRNVYVPSNKLITGIAPQVELHYSRSLESASEMSVGSHILGQDVNNVSILNLTLGTTFNIGHDRNFTLAWVKPLRSETNREFDQEIRAYFNWLIR